MVYFVGAGPGAADLITVRGMRLLEKADVVIYAGSLVNPELLSYCKKECEIHNSAYMTLEEVLNVMEEAEKQKLAEFKAVLREMDEVYGAQKEGYQLKFDSLLLEALYRLLVDYAVRIGKEYIPQNQKAVQQIREVMRYIEEHYAKKLTVAQVAEHFGYTPNYLSKLLKRYLGLTVYQYLYEIRLDRICRDLQHPEARIMELLPKHGCENYKSVSRLFKERYGCSMKEMQKRYEKEKGDRPMGQWVRIRKAEMP